jgi:hypothetical protein
MKTVIEKAIVPFVTKAQIADQAKKTPDVDPNFTCPEFKVTDAHIQKKVTLVDGKSEPVVDYRYVVVTSTKTRYMGVDEADKAGLLDDQGGVILGISVSFTLGQAKVHA